MEFSNKNIVYIHLGTHKTGSTSLQKYLYDNRRILEAKGYLFPKNGYQKGHCHLDWELKNFTGYRPQFGSWHGLVEEMSHTNCENTIITAEGFSLLSLEQFKKIKNYLAGCKIKIILYLRSQDEYILSAYYERFKNDELQNTDISQYGIDYIAELDYLGMIEKIQGVFGKEHVIIKKYNSKQNIVSDFLRTIGLDIADFPEKKYEFNQSCDWKTLHLVRSICKLCFFLNTTKQRLIKKELLHNKFVAQFVKIIPSGVFPRYPGKNILQKYENINKRLKEEYNVDILG